MTDVSKLALKGSSKTVADYFEFAIHSILFQRNIYPPEDFITVRKYGLPLLVSNESDVVEYVGQIMSQVKKWIYGKKLCKLAVVIVSKDTGDRAERWDFDLSIINEENGEGEAERDSSEVKSRDQVQKEIQRILRQITSSVSYLPILNDDNYSFNVLCYTDANSGVPNQWIDTNGDTKALEGDNVENVEFASFSTNIHKVGTFVTYKVQD